MTRTTISGASTVGDGSGKGGDQCKCDPRGGVVTQPDSPDARNIEAPRQVQLQEFIVIDASDHAVFLKDLAELCRQYGACLLGGATVDLPPDA